MKKLMKPAFLPIFTLAAGVLGLALRAWLFFGGTDQKGLLVSSHPANALIFILTALVLAVLFICMVFGILQIQRTMKAAGKDNR